MGGIELERAMGRPREFDIEQALDAATGVFWAKGYEGASYEDLTQATGVARPGLYAAFGNKEELFRRVLQRYSDLYMGYVAEALEEPTSRRMARRIFRGAAEITTRFPDHRGCLGVNAGLACSDNSESVRRLLIDFRSEGEEAVRARLEEFRTEGDLPGSTDTEALAAYVMAVVHGMAVQAKAGFSRAKLEALADQALAGWPSAR